MGTLTIATFMTRHGTMQAPGGPPRTPRAASNTAAGASPTSATTWIMSSAAPSPTPTAFCSAAGPYEIFAASWPTFSDKDDPVAPKLNMLPKYVVSTTLDNPEWGPITVIRGDIPAEVAKLKRPSGLTGEA